MIDKGDNFCVCGHDLKEHSVGGQCSISGCHCDDPRNYKEMIERVKNILFSVFSDVEQAK